MTLADALKQQLPFVRRRIWANHDDALEVTYLGEHYAIWATLHSPSCRLIADTPGFTDEERDRWRKAAKQPLLLVGLGDEDDWEAVPPDVVEGIRNAEGSAS